MARCKAHRCPEYDIPDDRFFCVWHWDLLADEVKGAQEMLMDAYGTENWSLALSSVLSALRQIEARTGTPW